LVHHCNPGFLSLGSGFAEKMPLEVISPGANKMVPVLTGRPLDHVENGGSGNDIDPILQRLRKRKARIAQELEEAAANDLVQESIRDFCLRTKERLDKCATFDMTRQFLIDHVQRVIYLRDHVTLIGSVPVRRGTRQAPVPVPFRIEGELDRKAIQARPHNLRPDDGRWKKLNVDP
jgi:hypothetical protein